MNKKTAKIVNEIIQSKKGISKSKDIGRRINPIKPMMIALIFALGFSSVHTNRDFLEKKYAEALKSQPIEQEQVAEAENKLGETALSQDEVVMLEELQAAAKKPSAPLFSVNETTTVQPKVEEIAQPQVEEIAQPQANQKVESKKVIVEEKPTYNKWTDGKVNYTQYKDNRSVNLQQKLDDFLKNIDNQIANKERTDKLRNNLNEQEKSTYLSRMEKIKNRAKIAVEIAYGQEKLELSKNFCIDTMETKDRFVIQVGGKIIYAVSFLVDITSEISEVERNAEKEIDRLRTPTYIDENGEEKEFDATQNVLNIKGSTAIENMLNGNLNQKLKTLENIANTAENRFNLDVVYSPEDDYVVHIVNKKYVMSATMKVDGKSVDMTESAQWTLDKENYSKMIYSGREQ